MLIQVILEKLAHNTLAKLDILKDCQKKLGGMGHDAIVSTELSKISLEAKCLSLAALEDGRLASGSNDNTVKIWNVTPGEKPTLISTLRRFENDFCALAALEGGRLASGSDNHTVKIWNVTPGEKPTLISTLEGHENDVYALAALKDGRLASGSDDNTVKIWNVIPGEKPTLISTLEGHEDWVRALAALKGRRLASGSYDNTVKIWNVESGKEPTLIFSFEAHEDWVVALAALEGGRLASGSNDHTVKIWNVTPEEEPTLISTLEGHEGGVCALTALEGGRLASGSTDGIVKIWNVTPGEKPTLISTLEGEEGGVLALAALEDGRFASGNEDSIVKIWQVGEPLQPTDGKEILEVLAAVLVNRSLQTLSLAGIALRGALLERVAEVFRVRTDLISVDLSDCSLDDAAMIHLTKELQANRGLIQLELSKNQISSPLIRQCLTHVALNRIKRGQAMRTDKNDEKLWGSSFEMLLKEKRLDDISLVFDAPFCGAVLTDLFPSISKNELQAFDATGIVFIGALIRYWRHLLSEYWQMATFPTEGVFIEYRVVTREMLGELGFLHSEFAITNYNEWLEAIRGGYARGEVAVLLERIQTIADGIEQKRPEFAKFQSMPAAQLAALKNELKNFETRYRTSLLEAYPIPTGTSLTQAEQTRFLAMATAHIQHHQAEALATLLKDVPLLDLERSKPPLLIEALRAEAKTCFRFLTERGVNRHWEDTETQDDVLHRIAREPTLLQRFCDWGGLRLDVEVSAQVEKDKGLQRKWFKEIDPTRSSHLLKLRRNQVVGQALDTNDSFFDALARALNQIERSNRHDANSLRALCHQFYQEHLKMVEDWNREVGRKLSPEQGYSDIQYTQAACNHLAGGHLAVPGLMPIEGRILCSVLNVPGIRCVEIELGENDVGVPHYFCVTSEKMTSCEPPDWDDEIPTLIVIKNQGHFLPILKAQRGYQHLLNHQNRRGETCLHLLAMQGEHALLPVLKQAGVVVYPNCDNETPLHIAIRCHQISFIEHYINVFDLRTPFEVSNLSPQEAIQQFKAYLKKIAPYQKRLLLTAIHHYDRATFQTLKRLLPLSLFEAALSSIHLYCQDPFGINQNMEGSGKTLAHWAVDSTASLEILKELFELKSELEYPNASRNLPLHDALSKRLTLTDKAERDENLAVIQFLAQHSSSASLKFPNDHKQTPLDIAYLVDEQAKAKGYPEESVFTLLKGNGSLVAEQSNPSFAVVPFKPKNLEPLKGLEISVLHGLLAVGLDQSMPDGGTVMHLAIAAGELNLFQSLLFAHPRGLFWVEQINSPGHYLLDSTLIRTEQETEPAASSRFSMMVTLLQLGLRACDHIRDLIGELERLSLGREALMTEHGINQETIAVWVKELRHLAEVERHTVQALRVLQIECVVEPQLQCREAKEYFAKNPNTQKFHERLILKLNQIVTAADVVATGIVAHQNTGKLNTAATVIHLLGMAFPLIPVVGDMAKSAASKVVEELQHLDHDRELNALKRLSKRAGASPEDRQQWIGNLARELTLRYETQLHWLCPHTAGLQGFLDSFLQDATTWGGVRSKLTQEADPTDAEILAEFLVLRMVECLKAPEWVDERSVEEQLLSAALVPPSFLGFLKQSLSKKLGFQVIRTRDQREWSLPGVVTETGIQTLEGELYTGNDSNVALYGYRLGSAEEAIQFGMEKIGEEPRPPCPLELQLIAQPPQIHCTDSILTHLAEIVADKAVGGYLGQGPQPAGYGLEMAPAKRKEWILFVKKAFDCKQHPTLSAKQYQKLEQKLSELLKDKMRVTPGKSIFSKKMHLHTDWPKDNTAREKFIENLRQCIKETLIPEVSTTRIVRRRGIGFFAGERASDMSQRERSSAGPTNSLVCTGP